MRGCVVIDLWRALHIKSGEEFEEISIERAAPAVEDLHTRISHHLTPAHTHTHTRDRVKRV